MEGKGRRILSITRPIIFILKDLSPFATVRQEMTLYFAAMRGLATMKVLSPKPGRRII
ncbi:hypothetical protein DESC_380007 [Desulfosarcina cetonica]|nr:hypothetical protein DESC_380007 [Desulfosarcina cetonica]